MTNKDVDMTDDWMNPQRGFFGSQTFKLEEDINRVDYLIERAYAQPVFGPAGSITQWRTWSSHKTTTERDTAIKKLSDEHPMWILRHRDAHPYYEQRGLPSPGSGPHPGIND